MLKKNKYLLILLLLSALFCAGAYYYQFVFLRNESIKKLGSCEPYDFKKNIDNDQYFMTWKTKSECSGYVKYGSNEKDLPYIALDEKGVTKLKNHSVKLSGIKKDDRYFFVIYSDEKMYGANKSPIEILFD